MPDNAAHQLKVELTLKWLHEDNYEAKVSVTVNDTCYHEGELKRGLPPETHGTGLTEDLTFAFTHTGEECGQMERAVVKSIQIPFSPEKLNVTAYVTVNGKVAGKDTKPFPRKM